MNEITQGQHEWLLQRERHLLKHSEVACSTETQSDTCSAMFKVRPYKSARLESS